LGITSEEELKSHLENGAIGKAFGPRLAQHVRQGLTETHAMLLYHDDELRAALEAFLVGPCRARRAEPAGDYRRRVEVIEELVFLVETDDFAGVIARLQRYGGRTPLFASEPDTALFALSSGIELRLQLTTKKNWEFHMLGCTGSKAHLRKLTAVSGSLRQLNADSFPTETAFHRKLGLSFIEPELREGRDEVRQAKTGQLPDLVMRDDFRGICTPTRSRATAAILSRLWRRHGARLRLCRHQRPLAKSEDRTWRFGRGSLGADPVYRPAEWPIAGFSYSQIE
jgi:DNA polymerase (family 10)